MKLKTGLVKEIEEKKQFEKEQNILKTKHSISDANIIIVEKNHIFKFITNLIVDVFKLIFKIILLLLAFIGLVSLVYPQPRQEILKIIIDTYSELIHYFK